MMNLRLSVEKYRYATSIVMPCSRSSSRPSVKQGQINFARPVVPNFVESF